MESRTKGNEKYSFAADAIHGRAAMPCNAKGVDSIPSPSVLDKNNGFLKSRYFLVEHRGLEPLTPTLPVLCAPNCANAPCFHFNTLSIVCQVFLAKVAHVFCSSFDFFSFFLIFRSFFIRFSVFLKNIFNFFSTFSQKALFFFCLLLYNDR